MKSPQSKAQRKASRQARNARVAANRAALSGEVAELKPRRAKPHYQKDAGLDWLLGKKGIDKLMVRAGKLYGIWWSAEQEEGTAPIASGIASAGMPHVTSSGVDHIAIMARAERAADSAAWKIDCAAKLLAARNRLGHRTGLIAVCDVICGAGKRPREITTDQRELDDMAGDVFVALNMLVEHFDKTEPGWRRAEFGELQQTRRAARGRPKKKLAKV